SNNRSSQLLGVSRSCARPGAQTSTLRRVPTSEWTPWSTEGRAEGSGVMPPLNTARRTRTTARAARSGDAAHHVVGHQPAGAGEDDAVTARLEPALVDQLVHVAEEGAFDPLGEADPQHHILEVACAGVGPLTVGTRALPRREPSGVGGGMLDVPPALAVEEGVRPRTDPPPLAAVPVAGVVPAWRGLVASPVRQLVPVQPGRGEQVVGQQVLVRGLVVVRHDHLAAAHLAGERGAL